MSKRQEYRQHSKSTLLRTTQILWAEREGVRSRERAKWTRIALAMATWAFLAGLAVARLLPS